MPKAKRTTGRDRPDEREAQSEARQPDDAARLRGLLADLAQLQGYLDERGAHTYELAQRFMANARRDPSSRAYDERQATMLEYQNYIWHEIAGRVDQLLARYAPTHAGEPGEEDAAATRPEGGDGA